MLYLLEKQSTQLTYFKMAFFGFGDHIGIDSHQLTSVRNSKSALIMMKIQLLVLYIFHCIICCVINNKMPGGLFGILSSLRKEKK